MIIRGILHIFTEQGMERFIWAIQDERFIQRNAPRGYCRKCGLYLRGGMDGPYLTIEELRLKADEITKSDALVEEKIPRIPFRPFCKPEEHEEEYSDAWSYKGLHEVKTGDHLTVFEQEDPTKILWEGLVALENVEEFHPGEPIGIDRNKWKRWFTKQFSGELRREEQEE